MRTASLTEPARVGSTNGAGGGLSASVASVGVSADLIDSGWSEDSALVVSVAIGNASPNVYELDPIHVVVLMQLDPAHPERTLSLRAAFIGTGTPPRRIPKVEDWAFPPLPIAPGASQRVWILFRGYRFDGSQTPRKITLELPGLDPRDGPPLRLVLADPTRGALRWEISDSPPSTLTFGVSNVTLYAPALTATGSAGVIGWTSWLGRLRYDYGLSSLLLVERGGVLASPTSSFAGTGLFAHLEWPALTGGPEPARWSVGPYLGGSAHALVANASAPNEAGAQKPNVYGALAGEAGLALTWFAAPLAATPFPVSLPARRATTLAPRWSLRLGVTTWRVRSIWSTGMVSAAEFAF